MLISTPRDWGNVVRDRRVELNMTQEHLAEKIGRARQWVVRFESGSAGSASIASLLTLLEALGLIAEVSQRDQGEYLDGDESPAATWMELTVSDQGQS